MDFCTHPHAVIGITHMICSCHFVHVPARAGVALFMFVSCLSWRVAGCRCGARWLCTRWHNRPSHKLWDTPGAPSVPIGCASLPPGPPHTAQRQAPAPSRSTGPPWPSTPSWTSARPSSRRSKPRQPATTRSAWTRCDLAGGGVAVGFPIFQHMARSCHVLCDAQLSFVS